MEKVLEDNYIENFNNYKSVLDQFEELEIGELTEYPIVSYTVKDTICKTTKLPLQLHFDIRVEANLYVLTDNALNFKEASLSDETKDLINDYLEGSQVKFNFEHNLVYVKLGTLEEDFNLNFLCKQFIDALIYINNLLK